MSSKSDIKGDPLNATFVNHGFDPGLVCQRFFKLRWTSLNFYVIHETFHTG